MSSLMIYPYDEGFEPILQKKELLCQYDIQKLVSISGWGLIGKSVECEGSSYEIEDNFLRALDSCESVCFIETQRKVSFEGIILPSLYEAIKRKKKIIITRYLVPEELRLIKKIEYKDIYICDKTNILNEKILLEILPINIPVIFCTGIAENMGKFETQLEIFKDFVDEGYKVSWISSNRNALLLGEHIIPTYMYQDIEAGYMKIVNFNHFVKEIEREYQPEVILIGIPGGVGAVSDRIIGDFGILAFQISEAVRPDWLVHNIPYSNEIEENIKFIQKKVQRILSKEIDVFNVVPRYLEVRESEYRKNISYVSLNKEFLMQHVKEYEKLAICNRDKSGEHLLKRIIEDLEDD